MKKLFHFFSTYFWLYAGLCVTIILFVIFTVVVFTISWAFAADVTLQWDANTEPDLAGYLVYQADRIADHTSAWQKITPELITEPTFVVIGLADANYAWLVVAVDTEGNPSFVSNMVERYDRTPPLPPGNLRK